MIRVLIVDDHPLLRSGVRDLLQTSSDVRVVAEAASAEEACEHLDREQPDVLLLDISLPGQSGVDLLQQLRRERPALPVLFLSMHPETSFAIPLLRAGASGYLTKTAPPDELMRAVRVAAAGQKYIAPLPVQSSSATAGAMYFWPAAATRTARISSSGGAVLVR